MAERPFTCNVANPPAAAIQRARRLLRSTKCEKVLIIHDGKVYHFNFQVQPDNSNVVTLFSKEKH